MRRAVRSASTGWFMSCRASKIVTRSYRPDSAGSLASRTAGVTRSASAAVVTFRRAVSIDSESTSIGCPGRRAGPAAAGHRGRRHHLHPRNRRVRPRHCGRLLRARDARGARRARNALRGAAAPAARDQRGGPDNAPRSWNGRADTITTKLSACEFGCRPTQSRPKAT
jgi:hypothetical protein